MNLALYAAHLWNRQAFKRFKNSITDVKGVQSNLLRKLLTNSAYSRFGESKGLSSSWDWQELRGQLPVTDYQDWQPWISLAQKSPDEAILTRSAIRRFQPTSGSTSACKWIPYTEEFMKEMDEAASVWLFDLGRRYPGVLEGRHYWSLSWIPNNLRHQCAADDLEHFPFWKRQLLTRIMAVSREVAFTATIDESRLQSLRQLVAARDLSLISVWSPTFLLSLLADLSRLRAEIGDQLEIGSPERRLLSRWNGDLSSEFLQELWPKLTLVSAWDSAQSYPFAERLKALFRFCNFQGKGLWATEGVVTIPIADEFPLALTSHVFEFKDLSTGRIALPWELEKSQVVQPILSTGNGIWRYALPDRMIVTHMNGGWPSLKFEGRIASADLVGEKLDSVIVENLLAELSRKWPHLKGISLLGFSRLPGYVALVEGHEENQQLEVATWLESQLRKNFHYNLARDLNQICACRIHFCENAQIPYGDWMKKESQLAGAMKIEALTVTDAEFRGEP